MKDFFKNHKKAVISTVCLVVLVAVIAVIAMFATTSFAENSSIGKQNAQNFAFADAGIDPLEAKKLETEFKFKNGQFVYEIEFESNGTEYDYWIKASDGSIVKKEMDATDEIVNQKQQEENNTQVSENVQKEENIQNDEKKEVTTNSDNNNQEKQASENNSKDKTENNSNTADTISIEKAKSKALSNAGVSEKDVTFTKTKLDYDDGVKVYDIEFYTTDNKYEYEINATTGKIYSKEIEKRKSKPSNNTSTNTTNSTSNNTSNNESAYIGVDKAKSIALNHAGVSNVTFEKAKLDRDDGQTVYEIEFYKDGMEYSYEIDAITGKILDYDIDEDD